MLTICGTQVRGCGLWQSVQATPLCSWIEECQAIVGAPVWQLQAQVLPAGFLDLAVRIVAGGAVEAVGAANLVRAGNLLELLHVAVALVADSRRDRAQVLRGAAERRQILRRADVSLAAGRIARRPAAWNDARAIRPAGAAGSAVSPGWVVAGVPGGTL